MDPSFDFEEPELFTAGTVGPRGQRVFYLQFGNAGNLVALRLEKQQVLTLAEYLAQLLDRVDEPAPDSVPLALDLIEPVNAAWIVASIGVGFDSDTDLFVFEAEQMLDDNDDAEPASALLRVTRGQVKAFIDKARDLMSAGRPPCRFCGSPLNDDDQWCPCFN